MSSTFISIPSIGQTGNTGPSSPPAGDDTQVQYNDGGSDFGADSGFTWDKTAKELHVDNSGGFDGGWVGSVDDVAFSIFANNVDLIRLGHSTDPIDVAVGSDVDNISVPGSKTSRFGIQETTEGTTDYGFAMWLSGGNATIPFFSATSDEGNTDIGGKVEIVGSLNMHQELGHSTGNITNVRDPVNAQDAATKHYVDTSAGYTPSVSANWTGADPTTIQQALDRIAAALGPIA